MQARKTLNLNIFLRNGMFFTMISSLIVKKLVLSMEIKEMTFIGSEHLNDIKGYYYCYYVTTYSFGHPFEVMLLNKD